MGICSFKPKNSKPKIFYSLQIRPAGVRISTQVLAEFKKGLTINQPFPDLLSARKSTINIQRNSEDMDCQTAEILTTPKSIEECLEIQNALHSHFLFRGLNDDILLDLVENMICYQLNKNENVFKQGDPGYNFFIISSGLVDVIVNSVKVKTLERGQAFGEIALIHNTERKATITALTRVRLWGLARECFKKIVTIGNERYYQENRNFLQSIPVFAQLSARQMEELVTSITIQTFNNGERIVREFEDKPEFFIIKEGKVNIYYKNENLAYLGKGDYFGEQSLIYNSIRKASARALDVTVLLMVTKDSLIRILGGNLETVLYYNTIKIAFKTDPVFSVFTNNQVNKLLEKIIVKEITGNNTRYPTEELWIIIKGKILEDNEVLEPYKCINSSALLGKQIFSIETETEKATIAILTRKLFENTFNVPLSTLIECNQVLNSLKKIFVFSLLPEKSLEKLSGLIKCATYPEGSVIFKEGDEGSDFFIIKSGNVKIISNGKELRSLSQFDYFGDRSILFDEPRSASAITSSFCEFWKISRTSFEQVVDQGLKFYLKTKCKLLTNKFPISSLQYVRYIGKGAYSKVLLVRNEELEMNYVLKVIDKETIDKHNLMRRLIEEKKTHSILNFQFLPTLVNTYKNNNCLSFLCEYFPGPSILKVIQDFGGIQLKQVHFFTSVILLTLEHLHRNGVIFRGIAPENIIVDHLGYPILVEMYLSKLITDRTYTVLGVPHYLSPEMIKGKGYSFSSDYWSLGILIYEMIFTFVPFGSNLEDPYLTYKEILQSDLKYPVFTKRNMKVNGLIDLLLNKTPSNRGNIESIMSHPWFDGTPWESLLSKKVVPDFIHSLNDEHKDQMDFSQVFQESEATWAKGF